MKNFGTTSIALAFLTTLMLLAPAVSASAVAIKPSDDCLGTEAESAVWDTYSCDGVHSSNGSVDCVGRYYRTSDGFQCNGV